MKIYYSSNIISINEFHSHVSIKQSLITKLNKREHLELTSDKLAICSRISHFKKGGFFFSTLYLLFTVGMLIVGIECNHMTTKRGSTDSKRLFRVNILRCQTPF